MAKDQTSLRLSDERFFADCFDLVQRSAYAPQIPPDMRDDVHQEACVEFLRSFKCFRGRNEPSAVAAWIRRIVHNKAADLYRQRDRERRRRSGPVELSTLACPEDLAPWEEQETITSVRAACNRSRPGVNCSSRGGENWRHHGYAVAADHARAVGCLAA